MKPETKEQVCKALKFGMKDSVLYNPKSGKSIAFARCGEEDIERVEEMSNKELMDSALSLAYCMDILGQTSISDCQMLYHIYEPEIADRGMGEKYSSKWERMMDKYDS